jgi:hypothetical protein
MSLNLSVLWHKPISLENGRAKGLTYICPYERLPPRAGVYVFGRHFGDTFAPLYIGKAKNIAKRVYQHFYNNVVLMNRIKDEGKLGPRAVIAGEWLPAPGQKLARALAVLERALIRHALAEGYEIFNLNGTKTPSDSIEASGYSAHGFLPRSMKVSR